MAIPTFFRILMVAMHIFFVIIGVVLFVGGIFIFKYIGETKILLAPEVTAKQSVVPIIGVTVVGILMVIGSTFGGYGTMKNNELLIVISAAAITPCFATLLALGVSLLLLRPSLLESVRKTLEFELRLNDSKGLLTTANSMFGCCGIADMDWCDRRYPPYEYCSSGSELCQRGCENAIWKGLFTPYLNGTVSALLTVSGILLGSLVLAFFVYRSVSEENKILKQRQLGVGVATNNRATKQD